MKLVIDIPDNEYSQICELRLHNRTFYDDTIRNGIPLEKIRTEISKLLDLLDANSVWYRLAIKDCLKVIDKYRKESE